MKPTCSISRHRCTSACATGALRSNLGTALTLGRPAALQESCEAVAAAGELAALVGCAAGTLLPSTFHLFWDLLGVLSREPIEIYMDAATYPIARWSAEHRAGQGVPLLPFPRHDATQLARLLGLRRSARPLVLCDGVSIGSDSQPPLAAYAALAHRHGGWLVIDDTQGLGVFGHSASPAAPYGLGGGGSLQWHSIGGDHVVVGSSLAKGFGVPVALLAGSAALLRRFERESASREHMSPPSMAVIHAARHALAVNRQDGDRLRLRLWRVVQRLRDGAGRARRRDPGRRVSSADAGASEHRRATASPRTAAQRRSHGAPWRSRQRGTTELHRQRRPQRDSHRSGRCAAVAGASGRW